MTKGTDRPHISQALKDLQQTGIAIVGMAGRFPGARNVESFWKNLHDGVESLTHFSDEDLLARGINPELLRHPDYVKAGIILEDADMFDASFFGLNPREAEIMDPQHRLFLESAWEALEDAGYDAEEYAGEIGVFAGSSMNTYVFNFYANSKLIESIGMYQTMLGNDKDFLATRVSYKLNLKGPSFTVQTACSTSLVAVHLACQSLLNGECDMALAGGVSARLPQDKGYLYVKDMVHSPDGHCRAFDAAAGGTNGGNGVGVVVLKRLSKALADGDNIHAIIRGSAINNDGSQKVGFTAPSIDGQMKVIAEALAIADVSPDTINYVEAHGTGTALGDPIEIAALTKAYRAGTQARTFCAVGSVKTNIGHLDVAAGIAGLIKTVLALENKMLPPSLFFEKPNPEIDFANSPFYVNTALAEWKNGKTPRRAGVSSFGMGGTNAHLVLEEVPHLESGAAARSWHLLTLSGRTSAALEKATDNLAAHFKRHPQIDIADAAYTLHVGRRAFNHRRTLVCRDVADALSQLESDASQRILTGEHEGGARPLVFMFPGQGAQYVNMGWEFYRDEPIFRAEVDRCAETLKQHLHFDLREVLYPPAEKVEEMRRRLKETSVTQPALFVVEYALAKLLMNWGVRPQAMIGHSLGEYTAACLAGVFSLEDALALVAARGRLMQSLPAGAMLAVTLPEQEVQSLLNEHLSLATVNAPSQCVVSGPTEAVEMFRQQLNARQLNTRLLNTSHAFHSHMMDDALSPFAKLVQRVKLKPPTIPFVSNLTGTWITNAEAADAGYWAKHLRHTVRFADGIQEFFKDEHSMLLEVGPGQTLSTLVGQHPGKPAAQVVRSSMRHAYKEGVDVEFLLTALGRLWLGGVPVDWQKFHAGEFRARISLPTYPFERQRYWLGAETHAQTPAADQTNSITNRNVDDWLYLPNWKRTVRARASSTEAQTSDKQNWLVFCDEQGVGADVARKLEAAGHEVVSVKRGQHFAMQENSCEIDRDKPDDYRALIRKLREINRLPTHVVHLWCVEGNAPLHPPAHLFREALASGFSSLISLAQALEKENFHRPLQITVVTNDMYDVTGEESLCPAKATVVAACKVIPQEYTNLACRSIDIALSGADGQQAQRLAEQIVTDLNATPTDEPVVAYRGAHRWTQTFERISLPESAPEAKRLREEGVYLITGGLGAVGFAFANYLALKLRANLVLTGRSELPGREAWDEWLAQHDEQDSAARAIRKLQSLESAGAQVLYVRADVSDEEQMRDVLERIRARFSALHGVIHAAGGSKESAFQTIQEMHDKAGEWFETKVDGSIVLEKVLPESGLDFCLLTSSLTSVLGGLGQAHYAASNLFMDAFAHRHNRHSSVPWTSVNWDGWQTGLETVGTAGVASGIAEYALSEEEGMQVFERLLSVEPVAQVVISTGDLQTRLDQWTKRTAHDATTKNQISSHGSLHPRPALQNVYVPPQTEIQQDVIAFWQRLLGIELIGIYDNFFELGGNSLLATQLMSQLREKFGVELALRGFFETPTVFGLG
ncbi:MAG TPA: SDR family NAD(P)-dependent oxidoreductase, partial [Pyrinomonadaceae bacterium]|nr:SDR family NAD(P)-dependent oxidoreductase [Pyrinomonadaceae bacterium]